MIPNLREEIHYMHAQLCSALADPNRILILYTLIDGPSNVTDLAEEVDISQPSVSRHLKILRESGLVESERVRHSVIYQLADDRVIGALDLLREVLADSLERQVELARTASESLALHK